ncbi:MAG: TonB-dependent receptor [Bryobacterales bacterium]|nr:TonB-dependent receptor [Bryobacterales bacterium]
MQRFLLIFFAAILCFAQSDRGTITGRILDPASAAIPAAAVVATHIDTGVRYPARTNETGNFTIPQLPVGRFEVSVEAAGFRRLVRRDIVINVAQTLTLNATLEVGQVEQTVEVTGQAPLLESNTSDLGTVVSTERVVDLPLAVSGNMRHPGSFVFLAPGVTGDTSNTQINGSQNRAKEVLMDGIGSTSPESGGLLFTYPPVEAIGEFKLVSNNFTAEYGRTGGGFEVYTTRSGGNQFHGALFEYLRNDKLDARGFIAASRAINRQNEYGVAIGGPVLLPRLYNGKNKTFFHFVYTGFQFRAGALNQLVSLPTDPMKQGDFSSVTRGNQTTLIYDPNTNRPDAGGFTRDPFPGNRIPIARFSEVSRKSLALVPAATLPGLQNNFAVIGNQQFTRHVYSTRFDQNFSEQNRLNMFLYWNRQESVAPERIPGALSPALREERPSFWGRVNHDLLLTPTVLNNFRAGFTREPQRWARTQSGQGYLTAIGLRGVNPPGDVFPRVQFTDGALTNWSDETKNTGQQVNNTLQISDTVSWVKGNHNIKIGMDARWMQTNGADPFDQQGNFRFNSVETALPTAAGRANSGHSFASYLLGLVNNASYNGLFVVPGNRYRYLATFFQDDWKLTRKLTLNLGMRYEIYFPRTEAYNNFSGFDASLPNPGAAGRLGAVRFLGDGPGRDNSRTSFADTYYRNFGPRFGFAYQAASKTVLRGGYGIYFAQGNATAGLRSSQQYVFGFNAAVSYATQDLGITPAFRWDNGFPTDWPRPPFIDPTVQNGQNVNAILAGDGRPPYYQSYQMSVQQELPAAMVLDLAYVGVKGTRLGNGLSNLNELDPRFLNLGATLTQNIASAAASQAGIASPYAAFRGSVAQALRPYPQYLNIPNRSNPNGNSTYHAFQMKLERRFRGGLTLLGSYTRAKTISDGDIQAGGGPGGQTFYNQRLEKGLSTNDIPNVVAVSYLYELPFGPGKRILNRGGIAGALAGGWQFNGIHQYQTGRPVVLTANNTLPLFNGLLRPDVLSSSLSAPVSNPLADRWINPAAFAVPTGFRLGTAARSYGSLRQDDFWNENFGLLKRTPIKEGMSLVFRAEFFNVFNHTVFGSPQGNVSNTAFGRVSAQSNTPRQGQVALRLEF